MLEWLRWVLFLVAILWGIRSAEAQTIGKSNRVGTTVVPAPDHRTIDKSNYKEYEALLIPAMLRAVERGDFILTTKNLDFPYRHWDRFLEASEKNAGKFNVNEPGDLIDKSTGRIPKYNIYGYPFPRIDPKEPRAADKIIWNFNFQKYRFMGSREGLQGTYLSKSTGVERLIKSTENLLYYQGRPQGHELENSRGFLANEMLELTEPMNVKGTNRMTWNYLDERETTVFNYIPALRRVQQTSGIVRSDASVGSDVWDDLGHMWAGKNRTMKWKLVGERTVLAPFTKAMKDVVEEAPDGTITRKIPVIKWGFRTQNWGGVPWAPMDITFVPRPVWIIEQVPLNPLYRWGLHINYVDKETHVIWLKEVFETTGQFQTWVMFALHYSEAPSGNNTVGDPDAYLVVDEKNRHATVSERFKRPESMGCFIPASNHGPDFYTLNNFTVLSK